MRQWVVRNRVDGEVAAGQVLVQRDTELDRRVAAVGRDVAAEGGYFVRFPMPIEHGNRAVIYTYRDCALEEALDVSRPRGRCEVEVVVLETEEGVPNGSANAPGVKARGLERFRDRQHLAWDVERVWEHHGEKLKGTSQGERVTESIRTARLLRLP
jgi:hypothetical protein